MSLGVTALGVLALATPARAQPEAGAGPPLIELGAGVFGRYDFGETCKQDGDVVSCNSGNAFGGVEAAPRLRLAPLFSVGAFAAFGWKPGSEGSVSSDGSRVETHFTTFRLEAEGRLHPFGPGNADLWLGADAGVTGLTESADSYAEGDRITSTQSSTELDPIAGVGLGVDFKVLDFLAVGPEARVAVTRYADEPNVAVTLGLTGTLLIGR